jgi:hypothetical protein
MSQGANTNQDFDQISMTVISITAAAVVLCGFLIMIPAILAAVFVAEIFLSLSFKNGIYSFQAKQVKHLGWGLFFFLLMVSLPWRSGLEVFRGFLFIFLGSPVAMIVGIFLKFTQRILPARFAIQSITGIGLRIYLWMIWPMAGLYFFLKVKRSASPLIRNTNLNLNLSFKEQPNNFIKIGQYKGRFFNSYLNITYDMLKHHIHVLGASGFGKSVFLFHIVADLIRKGRGLLFVDLKADIDTVRQVIALAKEANRIDKIKFFSCANPEFSTHYNILGRGNANQLADRIMSSLIWSEEFYKNESASVLLKVLIPLVWIRDHTDYKPHLGNLLSAIKSPDYLSELKMKIKAEEVVMISHLEDVDRYLRDKDSYKNLQGLRTQIEGIILTDFGSKLCPVAGCEVIDIYEAVKNTEIVYFLLDSRRYSQSAKSLGRMILEDLKAASGEIDGTIAPEKRQAFNIIIDEFADMASDDFISFLDRARSSGMGTVVAHQEISDLKRISPETADRLMHLTSTTVSFLTKLPDSAEKIAAMAGTKTSWKMTEKAQQILGLNFKSGDISLREVEEFNLHPNTLKKLTVGEAVAIGKYPFSTSGVVKIHPPEKLNLSESEFRGILESIIFKIKLTDEREKPLPKLVKVDPVSAEF